MISEVVRIANNIREYLSYLQEVVGYQSFTLEGLVSEGRVWKNKECDFDELWQLLLHDDIDDPGGNSFIK